MILRTPGFGGNNGKHGVYIQAKQRDEEACQRVRNNFKKKILCLVRSGKSWTAWLPRTQRKPRKLWVRFFKCFCIIAMRMTFLSSYPGLPGITGVVGEKGSPGPPSLPGPSKNYNIFILLQYILFYHKLVL
jgi:hypothetical protein